MFKVFFRYYDGSFIKEIKVYSLSVHKSLDGTSFWRLQVSENRDEDMMLQTVYFNFWDICESCD